MLHPLGLPHPPYLFRILTRTLIMWVLVKTLFFVLFGVVEGASAFLFPSFGIPALLVDIDRRFLRERLLQENLGASEWWLIVSSLAACFVLDAIALGVASAFFAP